MAKQATKMSLFQEIALKNIKGDLTIDEMRGLYEVNNFWTPEELERAEVEFKNEDLRRHARKKLVDEDTGEIVHIVNVDRGARGEDGRQQVFEFLHEAPKEDLEWLAEYHIKRVRQAKSKVEMVFSEIARRFGRKAARQLRLRLDWPDPDSDNT